MQSIDHIILNSKIYNAMKNRLQNDETLSCEERERRLEMLLLCWMINCEKLDKLNWKIFKSPNFNIKLYVQRLRLYQKIKYAYEGREISEKPVNKSLNNETLEELHRVENFIDGFIKKCKTKRKNK